MPINIDAYNTILKELSSKNVMLVAVSKTKPTTDIEALYALGQKDFGENYVQELVDKQAALPKDIRWHFIGHLQSNKVKYIAPFVHLIQGVDSLKLLQEINKQGIKNNRIINCLLQIHIAQEETKFGLDETELAAVKEVLSSLANVRICGMMGMASFSDDLEKVSKEFNYLQLLFNRFSATLIDNNSFTTLSMGMSGDYQLAINCGSNMVRIGSLLFGTRNYTK